MTDVWQPIMKRKAIDDNFDKKSAYESNNPLCEVLKLKIPENWDVVPLSQVTDYQEGPGILAKDFTENGVPLLRLRNIESTTVKLEGCNFLDKNKVSQKWGHFALQEGDLLISTSASLGRVSIVSPEAIGTIAYTGIIRFRSKSEKLNQNFLRAFLSSSVFVQQAEQMATGSVIRHFGPSHLKQMAIILPNLKEQIFIANIFDSLDKRITVLRETNSTLESIAQALFKSWFIDFDPVHAKAEGREPEGMDAETAALFPDSFEESELGLIPKGWGIGILDDIAKTVGGQKQTKDFNSDVNYVGLEHMPRSSLGLFEWSTAEGLASAKSCFALGDILFGKLRPYFHKVVIAPFDGVCSTDILVCQSKKISFYGIVLMHLFSNSLINYASRLSNGAKMPRINWKDLAKYPIILPPEQLAESYSISIQPLLERMKENTQQAKVLATLRDILLPRLISGQLCLSKEEAKVLQHG